MTADDLRGHATMTNEEIIEDVRATIEIVRKSILMPHIDRDEFVALYTKADRARSVIRPLFFDPKVSREAVTIDGILIDLIHRLRRKD